MCRVMNDDGEGKGRRSDVKLFFSRYRTIQSMTQHIKLAYSCSALQSDEGRQAPPRLVDSKSNKLGIPGEHFRCVVSSPLAKWV